MQYFLLLHGKNGYANALQYYVTVYYISCSYYVSPLILLCFLSLCVCLLFHLDVKETRRGSLQIKPFTCYFMLLTSWACKHFTEAYCNIAEGIDIYHCSFNLCRQSSFTFEKQHVFPADKICSPSSAATGTWRSAVQSYWRNGVLAGYFPKDRTGDNLVMRGQDVRVDATISIQNMCGNCVQPRFVVEAQRFRCWMSVLSVQPRS
jgi:hypothetical protein